MEYPKEAHCALIVGATNCGKTVYMLNLLEGEYKDFFENIIFICPTLNVNKSYDREWIKKDSQVFSVDPGETLDECLEFLHEKFKGVETLFVIDDCSASRDIKKKQRTLSMLAFSGRHHNHSVWILTQKYNSILTDFREQVRWIALFFCKDKDSYYGCLRENDVIKDLEEKKKIKEKIDKTNYY